MYKRENIGRRVPLGQRFIRGTLQVYLAICSLEAKLFAPAFRLADLGGVVAKLLEQIAPVPFHMPEW